MALESFEIIILALMAFQFIIFWSIAQSLKSQINSTKKFEELAALIAKPLIKQITKSTKQRFLESLGAAFISKFASKSSDIMIELILSKFISQEEIQP